MCICIYIYTPTLCIIRDAPKRPPSSGPWQSLGPYSSRPHSKGPVAWPASKAKPRGEPGKPRGPCKGALGVPATLKRPCVDADLDIDVNVDTGIDVYIDSDEDMKVDRDTGIHVNVDVDTDMDMVEGLLSRAWLWSNNIVSRYIEGIQMGLGGSDLGHKN